MRILTKNGLKNKKRNLAGFLPLGSTLGPYLFKLFSATNSAV